MVAEAGGASFTTGVMPGTQFPVLQTVIVADEASNTIAADLPSMTAPTFATVDSGGEMQFGAGVMNGYTGLQDYSDLDWTRLGYWTDGGVWDYSEDGHRAAVVLGYQTPAGAVPVNGTATYSGRAQGRVFIPDHGSGSIHANAEEVGLSGTATMTADFANGTVVGTLTNMWAGGDPWFDDPLGGPWNDVAFTSTISGAAFSGTTAVASSPGGTRALASTGTGTIEGQFFGPAAQEAGAVWTIYDGSRAAIGTVGGKQP